MNRWEHFEHGADIGVRGFGASVAEAFEQAALALTAVVTDLTSVRPLERVEVHCEAPDNELLLAGTTTWCMCASRTKRPICATAPSAWEPSGARSKGSGRSPFEIASGWELPTGSWKASGKIHLPADMRPHMAPSTN